MRFEREKKELLRFKCKGRLLPPRPNNKVRNKIGGGGRNECVLHTTKRQKSRVGQES